MKCRLIVALCSCLVILISLNPLYSDENWKLVKHESGIKVFTKETADTDIDEFLGEAVIEADLSVIEAVFDNVQGQTEWMQDCIEAKLIDKKSRYEWIIYNVTNAPWPVEDRDVVVKTVTHRDPKNGLINIEINSTDHPDFPKIEGRVRMPGLEGGWEFKYLGSGKTKCAYRIKADPGGSLPVWLANKTTREIPYKTILSLMKMVKKKKYISEGKKIRDADGDVFKKFFYQKGN